MTCPCCSSKALRDRRRRCPGCNRTLAERRTWLLAARAAAEEAPEVVDPALEAHRAKGRPWKPRTPVHPERREITARDLVGGNGRAGAGWLTGEAA